MSAYGRLRAARNRQHYDADASKAKKLKVSSQEFSRDEDGTVYLHTNVKNAQRYTPHVTGLNGTPSGEHLSLADVGSTAHLNETVSLVAKKELATGVCRKDSAPSPNSVPFTGNRTCWGCAPERHPLWLSIYIEDKWIGYFEEDFSGFDRTNLLNALHAHPSCKAAIRRTSIPMSNVWVLNRGKSAYVTPKDGVLLSATCTLDELAIGRETVITDGSVAHRLLTLHIKEMYVDHREDSITGTAFLTALQSARTHTLANNDITITIAHVWPGVRSNTLFIRKRVVDTFQKVWKAAGYTNMAQHDGKRLLIFIGTPGIGKTAFGLYLLWHFFKQGENVVYYHNDGPNVHMIVIRNGQCIMNQRAKSSLEVCDGDVVIMDSTVPPMNAVHKAKHVIELSSPYYDNYGHFRDKHLGLLLCFPIWNNDEVEAFVQHVGDGYPRCCIEAASNIVGGCLSEILNILRKVWRRFDTHAHAANPTTVHSDIKAAAIASVQAACAKIDADGLERSTYRGASGNDGCQQLLNYIPDDCNRLGMVEPITSYVFSCVSSKLKPTFLRTMVSLMEKANSVANVSLLRSANFYFTHLLHRAAAIGGTYIWKARELCPNSSDTTVCDVSVRFYTQEPAMRQHCNTLLQGCAGVTLEYCLSPIDGIIPTGAVEYSDAVAKAPTIFITDVGVETLTISGRRNSGTEMPADDAEAEIRQFHHRTDPTAKELRVCFFRPSWAFDDFTAWVPAQNASEVEMRTVPLRQKQAKQAFFTSHCGSSVRLRQFAIEVPLSLFRRLLELVEEADRRKASMPEA